MLLSSLCAVKWSAYCLDIVAAIFILLSMLICGRKGFISCFVGVISTVVALVLAISLAKSAATLFAGIFGFTVNMASVLITGVVLFVAVKLLTLIVKGILTGLASKISLLSGINALLGTAFGALQAFLTVCGILALLKVFSIAWVTEYLGNTLFLGALYNHNPITGILGWFL